MAIEPLTITKARKWLSIAADAGHPIAAFYASSLAEQGEGGVQDLDKAYTWLVMAAKKGHKSAEEHLPILAGHYHPKQAIKLVIAVTGPSDSSKKNKLKQTEKEDPLLYDENKLVIRGSALEPEIINLIVAPISKQQVYDGKFTGKMKGKSCGNSAVNICTWSGRKEMEAAMQGIPSIFNSLINFH